MSLQDRFLDPAILLLPLFCRVTWYCEPLWIFLVFLKWPTLITSSRAASGLIFTVNIMSSSSSLGISLLHRQQLTHGSPPSLYTGPCQYHDPVPPCWNPRTRTHKAYPASSGHRRHVHRRHVHVMHQRYRIRRRRPGTTMWYHSNIEKISSMGLERPSNLQQRRLLIMVQDYWKTFFLEWRKIAGSGRRTCHV